MKKSNFQFKNPELTKLNFIVNDDFDKNNFQTMKINSKIDIYANEEDGKSAKVSLKLVLGDDIENSPFYIEIAMSAVFIWNDIIDDEKLKIVLEENAPSLLLSYMRPIISNITSNSKYPTYNLPFIDMRRAQHPNT